MNAQELLQKYNTPVEEGGYLYPESAPHIQEYTEKKFVSPAKGEIVEFPNQPGKKFIADGEGRLYTQDGKCVGYGGGKHVSRQAWRVYTTRQSGSWGFEHTYATVYSLEEAQQIVSEIDPTSR